MAGIYIHIPFCKKRCIYCDFYSTTDNALMESYIDAVVKELSFRLEELNGENITTIYIGGGTPSQLPAKLLARLVGALRRENNFENLEEFTIEVNPDDVTPEYMRHCRELGINRVSMGIQSFADEELMAINRRHTVDEARMAVEIIKNAGFSNISIDLIYGLPLQTLNSWLYSVKEAVALGVPHISCYNLSYEEGTALYRMRESGKVKECSEDDCVQMYDVLVSELTGAGYEHYEISNFSLPGKYSRHNSNYWNLTPYLGLGASAHSFDGVVRRYNPSSIKVYVQKVQETGKACEEEPETDWERFNEYIMVNLRTRWGVSLESVKSRFGLSLYHHLIKYSEKFLRGGVLRMDDGAIVLTEKGVMLADYVIRTLMYLP